jgi:hypothetical protein
MNGREWTGMRGMEEEKGLWLPFECENGRRDLELCKMNEGKMGQITNKMLADNRGEEGASQNTCKNRIIVLFIWGDNIQHYLF